MRTGDEIWLEQAMYFGTGKQFGKFSEQMKALQELQDAAQEKPPTEAQKAEAMKNSAIVTGLTMSVS